MSEITIQTKDSWIAWFSSVKVYLDGEKIGKISNGFEDSYTIESGNHSLQIKHALFNLYASPELSFEAVEEQETVFTAGFTYFARKFELVATIIVLIAIVSSVTILDPPVVYYVGILIGITAYFFREKFIYLRITELKPRFHDSDKKTEIPEYPNIIL